MPALDSWPHVFGFQFIVVLIFALTFLIKSLFNVRFKPRLCSEMKSAVRKRLKSEFCRTLILVLTYELKLRLTSDLYLGFKADIRLVLNPQLAFVLKPEVKAHFTPGVTPPVTQSPPCHALFQSPA